MPTLPLIADAAHDADDADAGGQSSLARLLTTKLPHVRTAADATLPAPSPETGEPSTPGLLIAACFPEVFAFPDGDSRDADILAYLRAVRGGVLLSTVAERVGQPEELTEARLHRMEKSDAVRKDGALYFLAWAWRHILPEVVAIETPANPDPTERELHDAVRAAAHARTSFAHRAFVALPDLAARRVAADPAFAARGVGLLALANGSGYVPTPLLDSPRTATVHWRPYYHLALALARLPDKRTIE